LTVVGSFKVHWPETYIVSAERLCIYPTITSSQLLKKLRL